MNSYRTLAHCTEAELSQLALLILTEYSEGQITVLTAQQGMVMLRMRESVASSQFNAGEILVTEVKLELDGIPGFGMVIGGSNRKAMAIALTDAAIRKGGELAGRLEQEIAALSQQLQTKRQKEFALIAKSKVDFELF
jgi:alpha-D-ribose 1-methylphosphonate 5-triphosphate synthase subunit PhnG